METCAGHQKKQQTEVRRVACTGSRAALPSHEADERAVCGARKAGALLGPGTDDLSAGDVCSDNRKAAAQVQHSAYAVVSPVSPPGKGTAAVKTHLCQAAAIPSSEEQPPASALPRGQSTWPFGEDLPFKDHRAVLLVSEFAGKCSHLVQETTGAPPAGCALPLEGRYLSPHCLRFLRSRTLRR